MNKIIFKPYLLKEFFDYKVREMCKSCKRYGCNAHCPPHTETVEYYKNILPTYKHGTLYYDAYEADYDKWKEIGKESSLKLHNFLLEERDRLFNNGHYFVSVFGAGGCKLCEKCSFPCRQPQKAISPIEATGVNVVELMKFLNIELKFPVQDEFYRIGIVLYD